MKKYTHVALMVVLVAMQSFANVNDKNISNQSLPILDSLNHDAALDLKIPRMTRFTTQDVPVIFTQIDELPILDITITFYGGSAKDDSIKEEGYGISAMTAKMMTQGTLNLDENAFAEEVELLGASLGATAYRDTFEFSFRSLSDEDTLNSALDLFLDMIAFPRFDEGVLRRNLAQADISFERAKQNPSHLAEVAFLKTLYGNHPYAISTSGTQKSVASIRRDDLVAYKDRYLTRNNAHIAITGDIDPVQARSIAQRLSAILPKGEEVQALPAPMTPKPKHVHIDYDSTQTHVYIGHLGEKYTKDETELQERANFSLGNSVLAGGNFNAYLMQEIRKKQGYTYGISGGMTTFDERGYYRISFATQTDKAKEAIIKTLDVIKQTRADGVLPSDLELVRASRKYAYPMSLATNTAIHRTASSLNYRGLPDEHIKNHLLRLERANLDGVNTAINKYIRPDEFIIVTVGRKKPDLSVIFD